MLSENRDAEATKAFLGKAIGKNGFPKKVVIDKNWANLAALVIKVII